MGKANGQLKGGLHLKTADGTPMANAMFSVSRVLGLEMKTFGDSTQALDLNGSPTTTMAAGNAARRSKSLPRGRRSTRASAPSHVAALAGRSPDGSGERFPEKRVH